MTIPTLKAPRPAQNIPPLREGDRLSRDEFERRYEAMPEGTRAELVEGVVRMPSPMRQDQHGGPHFDFITWLGTYAVFTPGVQGGVSSTIRLDMALLLLSWIGRAIAAVGTAFAISFLWNGCRPILEEHW